MIIADRSVWPVVSLCHTGPHTAAHAHTDGWLSAVTCVTQTHMTLHTHEYGTRHKKGNAKR